MTVLLPLKGIKRYSSKGQVYHYHRATSTRIKAQPGTAAFILEIEALDRKAAAKQAQAGTLHTLISEYRSSSAWGRLAEATQVSYQRAFDVIDKGFGTRKLVEVTPPFIAKGRDIVERKRGRWMANYFVTVLGILADFALERGSMTGENPARVVKKVRKATGASAVNRPWDAYECRAVLDAAPAYLRVPIALAMFAGFRKSDVLKMERIVVQRRAITVGDDTTDVDFIVLRTRKRDSDVAFPIHPELAAVLAGAPEHKSKTVAATSRGEAWTVSGFNSTFTKLIDRLEVAESVKPGLTFHGLRHTVGTRLVEAGGSIEDVQRLLGQRSAAMAQHYSKTADLGASHVRLVGKMRVLDARAIEHPNGRAMMASDNVQ